MLHILGGLDCPTSGTVEYGKHDLAHADEAGLILCRREHVGFVFQVYNLIPSLAGLENVALVANIAEHPMNPLDALELVGLSARKDHFLAQLAGGEQQRIAIARAVVKQPDILLCDEPTGALDYSTGRLVLEVLQRANTEQGASSRAVLVPSCRRTGRTR